MGGEPTAVEQRLLSISYSKLEHALRDAWHFASAKLNEPDADIALVEQYRDSVRKELEELCDEVLTLIDETILPHAKSGDVEVFCYKMCVHFLL